MPADLDVFLLVGNLLTRRDLDRHLHDIHTSDHFRHRVLHLHASIYLEHVEVAIAVQQELTRCRASVLHVLDELRSRLRDFLQLGAINVRRRRLFDHLLVAALQRTVTLPQIDRVAVLVAQHLQLDVPRVLQILLNKHGAVAEGRLSFLTRHPQHRSQRRLIMAHLHAATAAARRSLDDDRESDLLGNLDRLFLVLDGIGRAGEHRHTGGPGSLLAFDFVTQRLHRLGARSDELDLAVAARLREVRPLRQEPVARMDRIHIRDLRGRDQPRNVQVRILRRTAADADRAIRQLQIGRILVGRRVDTHGLNTQLAACTHDAEGDLTTIGNQYAFEHGVPVKKSRLVQAHRSGTDQE